MLLRVRIRMVPTIAPPSPERRRSGAQLGKGPGGDGEVLRLHGAQLGGTCVAARVDFRAKEEPKRLVWGDFWGVLRVYTLY